MIFAPLDRIQNFGSVGRKQRLGLPVGGKVGRIARKGGRLPKQYIICGALCKDQRFQQGIAGQPVAAMDAVAYSRGRAVRLLKSA